MDLISGEKPISFQAQKKQLARTFGIKPGLIVCLFLENFYSLRRMPSFSNVIRCCLYKAPIACLNAFLLQRNRE